MAVFQNVIFAIFITCIIYIATDFNFGFIFGLVFFIPVTIFSNIIVFLCCKKHTKRRSRFLDFPKMIAGHPSALKTYIEKAHANPPVLKIDGQYKGLALIKYTDYIPYQTWQADSSCEKDYNTQASLVILKIKTEYNTTEEIEKEYQVREPMLEKMTATVHGLIIYQKRHSSIYNIKKNAIFADDVCVFRFLSNCCGVLLFFFLHIFGVATCLENFIGIICKGYTVHVKKSISTGNDFSVPAYQPDPKLPNGEKVEKPLIPSLPQVPLIHAKAYTYVSNYNPNAIILTEQDKQSDIFKYYDGLFETMLANDPTLGSMALAGLIGRRTTMPVNQVFALQQAVSGNTAINIQPGMPGQQLQMQQVQQQFQIQQIIPQVEQPEFTEERSVDDVIDQMAEAAQDELGTLWSWTDPESTLMNSFYEFDF